MKRYIINLRAKVGLVIGLMVVFASCEPQVFTVPDSDKYSKVFMQSATESLVEINIEMEDTWHEILIGAGYGGVNLPEGDIQVNFKVDPSLVAGYNERNGTNYPVMPEDSYQLEGTTVSISKGKSNSNSISLKVNPTKFGAITGQLLPISIQSVDGNASVNEELRTAFYLVKGTYSINPYERLDRIDWSIAGFSTDENESVTAGGRAHHAIDGTTATFWATQWRAAKPGPPHFITIDMGSVKPLHGLYIAGRLTGDVPKSNGNPKEIVVETSLDGENWTYSQSYSMLNLIESEIWLDYTQNARFFKITIYQTYSNFYGTHIAEINAF